MLKEMSLKNKIILLILVPFGYGILLTIIHYFVKAGSINIPEIIAMAVGFAIANFFIALLTPSQEEESQRKERTWKELYRDFIKNGSGFHKLVLATYLFCLLLLTLILMIL